MIKCKQKKKIKSIKILNNVKLIQMIIKEKKFEMDVLIELETGELINLEMYNVYDENAERKSILYITKVVATKSLKRGEKYELARKVSQLNFVKGDHVHSPKRLIKRYTIINEEDITDRIMPDLYQIHIIDVDVKDKFSYTNINERFKLWIELISCENEKELNNIAKKDKIIGEVVKEMEAFSNDEWVQDYESKERLIESQHKTAMEKAEKKAKDENKKEIAKELLKDNQDMSYISKITKLSIEEIKELKEQLKN